MRKITQWCFAIFILAFSWHSNAQFGCDSAITLTNGYTATNITTLGDGSQDWNNNPSNSCVFNGYYGSDVYMFEYTSTTFEEISITIFSRSENAAAGFYTTCSGIDFSNCIEGSVLTTNANTTLTTILLPNQTIYIPIGVFTGALDFDIVSFNVNIITCPAPTSLSVSSTTASSATLAWTPGNSETDWEYVVQNQGTGVPTDSGTPTDSSTPTKTGLDAATLYEFYVRADCGSEDYSEWTGPFNFTTQCEVVTEFFEDFEATTGSELPICMAKVGTTGTVNSTNDVASGFGSTRCLFMASASESSRGVASLPTVNNADANTHQIRFNYRAPVASQTGQTLEFGYLTNPMDATTFMVLTSVTMESTSSAELIYAPTALPSGNVTFALRSGVENKNLRVDNIRWEPIPTCPFPNTLTASNFTPDSADLGWTESGSASTWDIEYGEDGFTPSGTPNIEDVTDNPYTLMGLDQGTAYQFYLRSDCSTGDVSDWVGPYNFSTTCSYFDLPYNQDFNSYLPTCWSEGNNTDVSEGPDGTNGGWSQSGFLNNSSDMAAMFSFSGSGDMDWLVTPTLDFSSGNNGISFSVGLTDFTGTGAVPMENDDEVLLLISEDNGINWTILETWNSTNEPSNLGDEYTIDLSSHTSATTKLAFWVNEGPTGVTGYKFFMNDFVADTFSTLSVQNLSYSENLVTYYPNPVRETLTLKAQKNIQTVTVYNMLGQQVLQVSPNVSSANLDLSHIEVGAYFVKIMVNGIPETIRIIKQSN